METRVHTKSQQPRLACVKSHSGRVEVWVIERDGKELVFDTPTPGLADMPRTMTDPETGLEYIPVRAESHTGLFFPLERGDLADILEVVNGPFPEPMKKAARAELRLHGELEPWKRDQRVVAHRADKRERVIRRINGRAAAQ